MPNEVWGETSYLSIPKINGCTVEVWDWISNFIPHFIMGVITYPYCDQSLIILVKGATGGIAWWAPRQMRIWTKQCSKCPSLKWHNERDGVSNYRRLDCLFNRLFKENIKALRHWPPWGESTGHRWIPLTKGWWRGKCFHLMASSWIFYSNGSTNKYNSLFGTIWNT